MSALPCNQAKMQVLKALVDLNEADLEAMHVWFSSQDFKEDINRMKKNKDAHQVIDKMRECIKKITPFEAEYSSENINMPKSGDTADCTKENTLHIDEFLYDEEDVEKLVQKGKVQRRYCVDCKSRNIEELTFISHSMSKLSIQYVFKVMLPPDLGDKSILDVGSRLGSVMFGGYFFSNASTITGIEINRECCKIVNQLIQQFDLDKNRIKVICSDVMNCADVIKDSIVIVINVLDFFVDEDKQKQMWQFFKANISKGSYLVANRSMEETFGMLGLYEEFSEWLQICRPCQLENEIYFDFDDFNYGDLCVYRVV